MNFFKKKKNKLDLNLVVITRRSTQLGFKTDWIKDKPSKFSLKKKYITYP